MSALKTTFSEKNLHDVWKNVKAKFPKRTAVGIDDQSRTAFSENINTEISKISSSVISGTYKFQELRLVRVEKPNGKIRLLNIPTVRDRFVQRVLIRFFKENYSTTWKLPHSFSSMGGNEGVHSTLKNIASKVKYNDHIIRADLSQFFDTIDRSLLRKTVKSKVKHRSLHKITIDSVRCETAIRNEYERKAFKESGLAKGMGIRQGMPISPVLAYLFLADIDKRYSSKMFRYVDDMVFYNSCKITLRKSFDSYRKAVENRGLRIHPLSYEPDAKTRPFDSAQPFEFLGIDIIRLENNQCVFRIPNKAMSKIIDKSKKICIFPDDKHKHQKRWLLDTSRKASGLVSDYRTAYGDLCQNWPQFENRLKQTQLHMCRKISKEIKRVEGIKGQKGKEMLLRAYGV